MKLSRRELVQSSLGLGAVTTIAGCLDLRRLLLRPRIGDVVVRNRSGAAREVHVIVSLISDNLDGFLQDPPDTDDPDPPADPIWIRDHDFRVSPGESEEQTGLIDGAGVYHIQATTDIDDVGRTIIPFGGDYISITIRDPDIEPSVQIGAVMRD